MHILLIAALALSTSNEPHKKVTVDHSYEYKYMEQVNIVNAAMSTYADTSCYDRDIFRKASEVFIDSLNKLTDLKNGIPDNTDTATESKEIELYIGVSVLAKDIIDKQNACVDKRDENNDNTDSVPIPAR